MHIFRWDLDKTYLETDFGSVRSLIRTALEPASQKRNVPGSATLLRALVQCNSDCRVHILSGSPTQMRSVLEEKLALDGIRVDNFVLKDNLENIRKGRLRAVTEQMGYKLPVLLTQRQGLGTSVRETLFGDDAEVDAVIYGVYADVIAGRLDERAVSQIMSAAGAYDKSIRKARKAVRKLRGSDAVDDIFIHLKYRTPLNRFEGLGPQVIPIHSWFQAAILLWRRGRVDAKGVAATANACAIQQSLTETHLANLVQDLVRRGMLQPAEALELLQSNPRFEPLLKPTKESIKQLGEIVPQAPRDHATVEGYLAFLKHRK